jgi:hypothetical protein
MKYPASPPAVASTIRPSTYRQYRMWFMDSHYRPEAKPRYEAEAVQ